MSNVNIELLNALHYHMVNGRLTSAELRHGSSFASMYLDFPVHIHHYSNGVGRAPGHTHTHTHTLASEGPPPTSPPPGGDGQLRSPDQARPARHQRHRPRGGPRHHGRVQQRQRHHRPGRRPRDAAGELRPGHAGGRRGGHQLWRSLPVSAYQTAIAAAGLTSLLDSEGQFTIFAPTNEAFEKIPQETLNRILGDPVALQGDQRGRGGGSHRCRSGSAELWTCPSQTCSSSTC